MKATSGLSRRKIPFLRQRTYLAVSWGLVLQVATRCFTHQKVGVSVVRYAQSGTGREGGGQAYIFNLINVAEDNNEKKGQPLRLDTISSEMQLTSTRSKIGSRITMRSYSVDAHRILPQQIGLLAWARRYAAYESLHSVWKNRVESVDKILFEDFINGLKRGRRWVLPQRELSIGYVIT